MWGDGDRCYSSWPQRPQHELVLVVIGPMVFAHIAPRDELAVHDSLLSEFNGERAHQENRREAADLTTPGDAPQNRHPKPRHRARTRLPPPGSGRPRKRKEH